MKKKMKKKKKKKKKERKRDEKRVEILIIQENKKKSRPSSQIAKERELTNRGEFLIYNVSEFLWPSIFESPAFFFP